MSIQKRNEIPAGTLNEDLAQAMCRRLAETHPDRHTHQWMPRRTEAGWQVVKIAIAPPEDNLKSETRADEKPQTGDDPRSAQMRNVGPWVTGG
jgi:hypothetical protein